MLGYKIPGGDLDDLEEWYGDDLNENGHFKIGKRVMLG